jgi:hypothetical protein
MFYDDIGTESKNHGWHRIPHDQNEKIRFNDWLRRCMAGGRGRLPSEFPGREADPAIASAHAVSVPSARYRTRNIEEIRPGDLVLARDEHGTQVGLRPVREVYRRTSFHLRHLTFADGQHRLQRLQTTDEHPFWSVTQNRFVTAGQLRRGELVTAPDGTCQTLAGTFRTEHPAGVPVFNFQVGEAHTYFVAQQGDNTPVLVHNADYDSTAVIGKLKDLQNISQGEHTLLRHMPDMGSPKANWEQNAQVLRLEMKKGLPIRDASVDPLSGTPLPYPGSFLAAESNLLENHGWIYDYATFLWRPPQ